MMDQDDLFDRDADVTGGQAKALPPRVGPRRLRSAVRNQIEFQQCSLDELLSEDHEARTVFRVGRHDVPLVESARSEAVQQSQYGLLQPPAKTCLIHGL